MEDAIFAANRLRTLLPRLQKGGGLSTNLAVQLGILATVVTVSLHGHSAIASRYFW
jgi:hypothetical protein